MVPQHLLTALTHLLMADTKPKRTTMATAIIIPLRTIILATVIMATVKWHHMTEMIITAKLTMGIATTAKLTMAAVITGIAITVKLTTAVVTMATVR